VFATLHTQDAPQTIDRIIDVFPPHQQQQVRVQLSTTLQGVVTQQLIPTADGNGRVAAIEVMVTTPAIRNLIREGKVHQIYSAMQAGGRFGMQTMDMSLAAHVKAGRITQQLAFERCHDPEELTRLMGSAGGLSAYAGGGDAGGGLGGGLGGGDMGGMGGMTMGGM
jgi:twitching motility protein PilT